MEKMGCAVECLVRGNCGGPRLPKLSEMVNPRRSCSITMGDGIAAQAPQAPQTPQGSFRLTA